MSNNIIRSSDPLLPTPMEEYDGKIIDPRGHEVKIKQAVDTLSNFVKDMAEKRIPSSTLCQVREAVGTLGHFAGYPANAYHLELYLESSYAQSSYFQVANFVGPYVEDITSRICKRIDLLNTPVTDLTTKKFFAINDNDDIPF